MKRVIRGIALLCLTLIVPALRGEDRHRTALDGPLPFLVAGSMITPRSGHTATLLPNGKVLITGGYGLGAFLSSAELFDPTTGTFSAAGNLTMLRSLHSATLLSNGKVLIAGGHDAHHLYLDSTELYDPSTGTFTATARMRTWRVAHTATLLTNGKVLLVGGNPIRFVTDRADAEVYDPSTGTSVRKNDLIASPYGGHTATRLTNGKVLLIADGIARLYEPGSELVTHLGQTMYAHSGQTSTQLADGKVLIAGGSGSANRGDELFDPATGRFTPTGTRVSGRTYSTATLLPNGNVLILGGSDGSGNEIYDVASGTFHSVTPSLTDRGGHTATLLLDGRVLIAGGYDRVTLDTPASAELFDSSAGTFHSPITGLGTARDGHTSTLLPNGKVLIAGGAGNDNAMDSAALYDPAIGAFTSTGNLLTARFGHTATLLSSGKVLVTGGYGPNRLTVAELYDPGTGTFAATGSLLVGDHTATLLPDGDVLVLGGAVAALYDPDTGLFSATGSPGTERRNHTATLLANGNVLIAGGIGPDDEPLPSAELYDPASRTFSVTGSMESAMPHTATLLRNGKVLIVGTGTTAALYDPRAATFATAGNVIQARDGSHTATVLGTGSVLLVGGAGVASAELYDPISSTFTTTTVPATARKRHTATLLTDGKVLISGGNDGAADLASAELFDAGLGFAESRRPAISSIPVSQTQPGTFAVTGTGFIGDSEASSAARGGSPTNFPIVQLQRVDNDLFLVAPASASWNCSLPVVFVAGLPSGHYRVTIVVNGIPSLQRLMVLGEPGPPPQLSITDCPIPEGNTGVTTAARFTISMSAPGGLVSFGYATSQPTPGLATFGGTNATPLVLVATASGAASEVASSITIANVPATITKITATLRGFGHAWPRDVDVVLVGPGGQHVVLMSDAGSDAALNGIDLTFDDSAATTLPPSPFPSGTYRPTNIADGEGTDPARAQGAGTELSIFNGTVPNGTWTLYASDDITGSGGSISGGWSLTITTTAGDFEARSGTIAIPMGQMSATITVPIIGDSGVEENEDFTVNLVMPFNAALADAQGVGIIINDDGTATPPANVNAAATAPNTVAISWTAAPNAGMYNIYRGRHSGGGVTYSKIGTTLVSWLSDTTAEPDTFYLYKVRSVASVESPDSNVDLATTVPFTDPALTGVPVKSVHFTELLTAVNAARALAGLGAIAFTPPAPAPGVSILRQHVIDLRSGLDAARGALALPLLSYTDSTTGELNVMKAAHLTELRDGLQ